MINLQEIKSPIKQEYKIFNKYFKNAFSIKIPLLTTLINVAYRRKENELFPILLFLSAKLHGKINEDTYKAAVLVELMHTAIKVHNNVHDVNVQKGIIKSVKKIWSSKLAILAGDYLLAQGLIYSVQNKNYEVLHLSSQVIKSLCEYQLNKSETESFLNYTIDEYMQNIKTNGSSMLRLSTVCGAKSVTQNKTDVNNMLSLGNCIGIIHRIHKDLIKFHSIHKQTNNYYNKIIGLPLIHMLNNNNISTNNKEVKEIILSQNNTSNYEVIINEIKKSKSIDYCHELLNSTKNSALQILDGYPETEIKMSFKKLISSYN